MTRSTYGPDQDSQNDYDEPDDLNVYGNLVGDPTDEDNNDDDGDDDEIPDGPDSSENQRERDKEGKLDEAREQFGDLLEDAKEGELKLTDYQRYWRRLKAIGLHHVDEAWRRDGPTRDAAAHIASIVKASQTSSSHLTQLYASRHMGAKFEPFDPGPDIIERPNVDKLDLYARPIRDDSLKSQLSHLETLFNTDMQLSKVRTLYSAFQEDQEVNRSSIKAYRRVTSGEKPCALCEIAADQIYFTSDLMPIHDNCMCDVEEADPSEITDKQQRYHHIGFVQTLLDTGDQKKVIQSLADQDAPPEDYHNLIKIEQHGDLGPVIVWGNQKWTGPRDLPNPLDPRPVPTIQGPGFRHENRMQRNQARVNQYRAQHFTDKAEPKYAPGHGLGSTHVTPSAPYGLPPITKTVGPVKRPGNVINIGSMGKVDVILRPKAVAAEAKAGLDFDHDKFSDILQAMQDKWYEQVPSDAWRRGGWNNARFNDQAKRNTLRAIDEMLTKYPDVKVDSFEIRDLDDGIVAETSYARRGSSTHAMTFSAKVMSRTPEKMMEYFKEAEDAGMYFTDASKDPYRAMVYHEYGHVLDKRGNQEARKHAGDTMGRLFVSQTPPEKMSSDALAKWMGEKDRLSGYSMQDYAVPGQISPRTGQPARMAMATGEAIAQAFDDVERRGDKASDLSHALHDLVVERSKVPEVDARWRPGSAALAAPESAVSRLAAVMTPDVPWKPAEMDAEANPHLSPEMQSIARELATDIYTKGAAVEPAITAAARSSVEHNGGYMSGLDFRLKTGPSLFRKIQAEALDGAGNVGANVTPQHLRDAAAAIKDSVRYTGIMPAEGYWQSGNELRKALESLGAKTIKDPQGLPLRGYRGRNMAFELNGTPFEMQVNTEQGVALKEENHEIYNDSRKLEAELKNSGKNPDDDPEYQKMLATMQENWDNIPITKGTPVVPTEKAAKGKDPSQILFTADHSAFYGPTVPNGVEAPLDDPEMIHREKVPSSLYGMDFVPGRAAEVAPARAMDPDKWNELPIVSIPHGTLIHANEPVLKARSIRKVTSGAVPFREGYVTKLWKDKRGGLHVVDGHHRVAMYNALGKDMPARILDQPTLEHLSKPTPEVPWTDAQMAKEDNPNLSPEIRDYARQLATDTFVKGSAVEPQITEISKRITEAQGGTMSGLDFRLKTGPSLYRKIQAEALDAAHSDGKAVTPQMVRDATAGIKDSVRYTALMPAEGYWASGSALRKALEDAGAKTIKDPVGIPLHGYRGRNLAFSLDGVQFEMQVNTEQGVAIKDEAHQIYNVSRKLESDLKVQGKVPADDPEYQRLLEEMQQKWDAIPITTGTPVVDNEKAAKSGDVGKILYTATDSKYRGPTIPGGEADLDAESMRKRARVASSAYGMQWVPDSPNAKIVADARAMPAENWDKLPVQVLPHGTPIQANEGTLKKSSIDKVTSGTEPFREGYVTKLWREPNGDLHVVDGHHRVAMYHALGKDMPVRILDRPALQRLSGDD